MAWPFKKQTKRMSKPPAAPKAAAKKPANLEGIKARLAKFESQLAKTNNNLSSLQSELDSSIHGINKEHAELFDTDATFTKKLKELGKLSAVVSDIDGELNSLREEIDEERKSFSKEITPLFDADTEHKKKIRTLEAADKNTLARISATGTAVANVAGRQAVFEKAWNPVVLKRVSETLDTLNKTISDIEKRDSKNARNLDRVQAGMLAISKHARDIEAEHTDAKFAARELSDKAKNLKETVEYFFKNTESLNNRINSNTAGLTEFTNTLELIKDKLLALENQAAQLAKISNTLEQASKSIDQLMQRVAYLEKATVKTIVLE